MTNTKNEPDLVVLGDFEEAWARMTEEEQGAAWYEIARSFNRRQRVKPLASGIVCALDWRSRLDAIRNYYREVEAEILAHEPYAWAFDVYEVDWPRLFTPIEAAIWSDIRTLGIPLYPQFPVTCQQDGRPDVTFFADFASPARKVAIECDGKAFHTNPDRDRRRDDLMRRNGWTVYRFTGAQCRQDFDSQTLQRSTVARELDRIARLHLGDEDLSRIPAGAQVFKGIDE